MNKNKIYVNRAWCNCNDIKTVDCDICDEILLFTMRDNYHTFSVGLATIVQCLEFAEKEGYVPPLPQEWWWCVHGSQPAPLA